MAGTDYHAHSYVCQLNEYQGRLSMCLDVVAHLLDLSVDALPEDWQRSACVLTRDMLEGLAESLPFPPEEMIKAVYVG